MSVNEPAPMKGSMKNDNGPAAAQARTGDGTSNAKALNNAWGF
jgi:hypothetical protein